MVDILNFLISRGRHINQYDFHNRTPLFLAALNNQKEVCEILKKHMANPFMTSKDGKRPIEVTTDESIKLILIKLQETMGPVVKIDYFKTNILKKFKDEIQADIEVKRQLEKEKENNK
jgi:ankyrin repeat protein